MASPRRLKEVFISITGTPVRLPNSSISLQYSGFTSFSTVCGPCAAIHMGHRGNHRLFFRPHLRGENHKRGIVGALQIIGGGFLLE